jgi:hypothetical protein
MRNAHKILVGKPEETIPLGGPSYRWEDDVKMGLSEAGREGLEQGWGTFSCWKAAFKKLQLDILKNVHYFVKI